MSGHRVFPGIVKDCPKMRNLPKIFLRSFENVTPAIWVRGGGGIFSSNLHDLQK